MANGISLLLEEKVWLFRHRKWSRIRNPLLPKGLFNHPSYHSELTFDQVLQDQYYSFWIVGPASLPHYNGALIYTYIRREDIQGPDHLILIDVPGTRTSKVLFAQEFPDLLCVLQSLTLLVFVGVLADAYTSSQHNI
jgi:hypothetical protein